MTDVDVDPELRGCANGDYGVGETAMAVSTLRT